MDNRPPKRVRQACQNCRRKKTRCSGDRPICAFCARLQQDCYYDDSWLAPVQASIPEVELPPRRLARTDTNDPTIAARIAAIESQLGTLEYSGAPSSSINYPDLAQSMLDGPVTGLSNMNSPGSQDRGTFSSLPASEIVQSLVDTYFVFCHCQPYCYFHEASFRRRLADNALPTWLLLAVVATASEFSDEPFFQGEQTRAADCYASIAWRDISENMFQEGDFMDLHAVQATNLLSVIDFSGKLNTRLPFLRIFPNRRNISCNLLISALGRETAGRYKQAWVKIGLAVRFAEALDLLSEPDQSLPSWQQEEHRRTFWSVYLLDRIVSCSPERTPTIQDADCALGLPVDLVGSSGSSSVDDRITLPQLVDQLDDMSRVGNSGFLCLIASTLGRIQRYSLRRSMPVGSYLPWNSQSEFASIYSTLLTFESYSPASLTDFTFALELESLKMGQEYASRSELGILATSHALYYLCQCLLHNPFLIRHRLQSVKAPIPPSFLEDVLRRSYKNATNLTLLLHSLLKRRLCLASSIGYCAVVAGVVHRIFEFAEDSSVRKSARESFKLSLEFLQTAPVRWRHYPRMAEALAGFNPDPTATSAMINPSLCTTLAPHPDAEQMWKLLDYGKLSQHTRESTRSQQEQETVLSGDIDSCDWTQVLETSADWIE